MKPANPPILTINGGSSSIKFGLFEAGDSPRRILAGAIDRIGMPQATLRVKGVDQADNFSRSVTAPDHTVAVDALMDWIEERSARGALTAVGHRLVHGGPKYFEPQRITTEMVEELRRLSPFDPEHLPQEILLTEAFHRRFPDLPQVACFDTAFHHDLPRVARLLPIPRRYETLGLRRYGFHGLSYAFLMEELARQAGAEAAQGRVILAHLGNGASLAAVREGKPVDTSMGSGHSAHSEHPEHPEHQEHQDHHAHMAADFRKRFWISLVLTLPILVLSPLLQTLVGLREAIRFPGDAYVLFGLSSAVFSYGGWPFLKGLVKELKSMQPGMMTLVAVAIGTAYLYSSAVVFGLAGKVFFRGLATLVDIMLLGHWIEMNSVMGASKALEALAQLMPSNAHKLMPDGSVKDVPLGELALDDKVLIKPGEKIPADGVVVEGESSVIEAMLTGESTPVTRKTGGKVIGGSINGEGALTIEVKGTGKDSFLSQIIDLVKQAQESKSKTQKLADTAAMWLTLVALGGGAITFHIWLVFMDREIAFAIERAAAATEEMTATPRHLAARSRQFVPWTPQQAVEALCALAYRR